MMILFPKPLCEHHHQRRIYPRSHPPHSAYAPRSLYHLLVARTGREGRSYGHLAKVQYTDHGIDGDVEAVWFHCRGRKAPCRLSTDEAVVGKIGG
ncbi:hypothetical protein F2Q68_00016071 [Brassica cretica]|uniref:Uncharacterized protein n=2 Tax=Brassica cretica TaxID=69181 RepID=A0A3N6RJ25_BRACR|nr:hypothetical protein F2Q68_00016071 [Brassica cretica]KAF3590126.1 hypothetical protein F2Q69_00029916 [Brassica cretica]KAF3606514.1 hypothetical protein DY000_02048603 [Brassica cretica]